MAEADAIEMSELDLFTSLLETHVDNIEDLPEFETFPLGSYNFKCEKLEVSIDQAKGSAAIKGIFSLVAALELVNDEDEAPKEGSLLSQQWGKEFGLKKFKKVFLPNFEAMQCNTLAEFIDQAAGMEFTMTIGHRKDKEKLDDAGQPVIYNDIRTAILAD